MPLCWLHSLPLPCSWGVVLAQGEGERRGEGRGRGERREERGERRGEERKRERERKSVTLLLLVAVFLELKHEVWELPDARDPHVWSDEDAPEAILPPFP